LLIRAATARERWPWWGRRFRLPTKSRYNYQKMRRSLSLLPLLFLLTSCGGWYLSHGNSGDQRHPLEKAAQEGNLPEVKRLLASGTDPNDQGAFGSPLNAAASHPNNVEIIQLLLSAGANPNGRGEQGQACWASPLLHAASTDLENTRALLDAGASVAPSKCSKLAVAWLKPPVLDLLVQHGFDLHYVDSNGRNELHLALAPPVVPPLEGIEYLLRSGVPLNARDASGKTPLAYWHEPRGFESHWFTTWLFERLGDDSYPQQQRENRTRISALLERSGALL
jgi:ankyrin repeat protein